MQELLEIMKKLRDPVGGCPWDIEQDFKSIAPCAIEEAYEVADAIERSDMASLKEELGDLLLQVVFHSQMAKEQGIFTFEDVVTAICHKLVSRHPHVFGDAKIDSASAQEKAWDDLKDKERGHASLMDGVTLGLPGLIRAVKLQKRAAKAGFDWKEAADVLDKIEEEINEIKEAIASGDKVGQVEELGDLLFACANLARKLGVDPEEATRACNRKFERRFRAMEQAADMDGREFSKLNLDEQEKLWNTVKKQSIK